MSFAVDEAIALLKSWHEDGSWIYVQVYSQNFGEHQSWAQVAQISDTEVCFAGEDALMPVPVAQCKFEHIGPDGIPEIVRQRFKETNSCLFMSFEGGAALIYGGQHGSQLVH